MDAVDTMLVHLLDCAVWQKEPNPALSRDVDWEALFILAQAHKVDAMLLDTICMLPEESAPPHNVLAAWQENAMVTMVGQAMMTEQLHALLASLYEKNIRAIVLKGVALKPLYPVPDLRTMSDADLLVTAEQFKEARAICDAFGMTLVETEPGVDVLQSAEGLRVELHQQLFDKTAYGFLAKLDEATMFPQDIARMEPVYGGDAYVFPPMEHAIFMLCHMAKHMITTGFGLRQTLDFILFVKAHEHTMDWHRFFAQTETLSLSAFASAMLSLGHVYFSLPMGVYDRGEATDARVAEGLLLDLLDAGVFGNRTDERKRSAAVVYRSFDAKDVKKGRIRRALFPSATSLKAPYLYARDHKVLLPIAWVHRLCVYAIGVITGKVQKGEAASGLKIADERIMLLSALGFRDQDKQA